MELISNAFSILALGDGDGDDPSNLCSNTGDSEIDKHKEYKLPLVWIDLEMTDSKNRRKEKKRGKTPEPEKKEGEKGRKEKKNLPDFQLRELQFSPGGLNIEVDRIIEIACIITDGSLSKSVEGPDLVVHQSQECMDNMGEWCRNHHGASGLTEKVLKSVISEREAELQVLEFVKRHVGTYKPLLAGNSVYMDYIFLKKYMPELAGIFSHVLVDVSSVKALCIRWYPKVCRKAPKKEKKHRALEDIRESILELKYFKENIFKASKK